MLGANDAVVLVVGALNVSELFELRFVGGVKSDLLFSELGLVDMLV